MNYMYTIYMHIYTDKDNYDNLKQFVCNNNDLNLSRSIEFEKV